MCAGYALKNRYSHYQLNAMARRPEQRSDRDWSPGQIRSAIRKLRRRISDVEGFDPSTVEDRRDPRIDTLVASIKGTLREIFGPNTASFRDYQSAATIDPNALNLSSLLPSEFIAGLEQGKARAIELLGGAIRMLEEKMEDDFPGEPLDNDPRIAMAGVGRAGAMMPGYGVPAPGNYYRSRSAQEVNAARYTELRTRVQLLELSLVELRSELSSFKPATTVGVGHNQGPAFVPIQIDDLDEIDRLIRLLKTAGPNPPADPSTLVEQNEKVARLGERIGNAILGLGSAMAAGAAKAAGGELLLSHWASLSHWIAVVGEALKTWIGF